MKKGLTLVELQIAMAIFVALALMVAVTYYAATKMFNEEREIVNITSQNRIALDNITNQVREAVSVVSNCSVCGPVNTSSSDTLILSLWPIDSNGDTFEPTGGEYDYIVYRMDSAPNDTNLLFEVYPNGTTSSRISVSKILATDVANILFEYDNADLAEATQVTITVTTEATTFIKTHTITESTTSKLRNK